MSVKFDFYSFLRKSSDVQMKQYVGCRYSPGYAACPELSQNRDIFDLLNPENVDAILASTDGYVIGELKEGKRKVEFI